MKGAVETDDRRTLGGVTGHLDGVFHGLGAAVGEQGHPFGIAGRQGIESFGQFHVRLVHGHMKTGVNVFGGLVLDGGNDFGMAVAHVVDTDAAREIDQFTAIDIHHHRTGGFLNECGDGVEGSLGNVEIPFFKQFLIPAWHRMTPFLSDECMA